MVIDKNYFLARLANGEDINNIGQDIADMMNEAMVEHTAMKEAEAAKAAEKAAAAEKAQAKRDLIEDMVDIIKNLAELEGMDPNDFTVNDEDIDEMVAAFSDLCQTVMLIKKIAEPQKQVKPVKTSRINASKSDDEVLNDFIKSLLS